MDLNEHPTVKQLRARKAEDERGAGTRRILQADWLRQLAMECGADDAGLVEIDRPAVTPQRGEILRHYPWTKTLLSFVVRMTREPVRSPARSVANLEFHHAGDQVDEVSRKIVRRLEEAGIRAINPAMGFPMEMNQFPSNGIWIVSHKPIAVAAGLGHMGIHRNVIHPKFGNFVLLGTILLDAEATAHDAPLDYNPCLACKLCVAACPVGAISPDGGFNFSACFTHNYREFMGGFTDWVEQVADSKDAMDYRKRISEPETASMWQSLSHRANYKSAYCMAVCPAGEDVIGPYLEDSETPSPGDRQAASRQIRTRLCRQGLRRRGIRQEPMEKQDREAGRQHASPARYRRLTVLHALRVPAKSGTRIKCHLPFHLYRR
jgi:Fe-S-cluster-containing hydrogenase component 2